MIELRGFGLFGGAATTAHLSRSAGPVRVSLAGETVSLHACIPQVHLLSTSLRFPSGRTLASVEHFAGAAAGLGLHDGFTLACSSGELPLLDGAASAWAEALVGLGLTPAAPRLRVVRAAELEQEGACYTFEPSDAAEVHVELVTDHPLLGRHASFTGDAAAFVRDVAPARTFAFAADLAAYAARGATPHVGPEQVVLVGDTLQAAGRPADAHEPVRHKLLDLLGDLFVHGGPPRGIVRARAPGHAKTHRVVARALAAGVLAFAPSAALAQTPRFVPSPLDLPTLDHLHPEITVDTRLGYFHGDGKRVHQDGAVLRQSYSIEAPIVPRRVFLGARYGFASGQSLADADATRRTSASVSGNTELTIRSIWVAPAGLALGGALDVVVPTAFYRSDSTSGDVASAARALSPNDWLSFWQRSLGFRPSLDVRIRAAGFTFQLRQSLSFAVGVMSNTDSSMVAETGLYAGQQIGAVELGLEVAELYYLDTLFTGAASKQRDATRARFAFMPELRYARGPLRPSLGVLYSPASSYDGTSVLSVNLDFHFAL